MRLLHAVAVNGAFKPLAAQHSVAVADAQQPQHCLTVSPNTQVQRYLKLEMQGQAVSANTGTLPLMLQTICRHGVFLLLSGFCIALLMTWSFVGYAGSCHAVCQLHVVQLSAYAAASAAEATQLPVPELDSPDQSGVGDTAAQYLPTTTTVREAPIAASAPQQPQSGLAVLHGTVPCNMTEASRFDSWLNQTRSSMQHSRCSNSNRSGAGHTMTENSQHWQNNGRQQQTQLQQPSLQQLLQLPVQQPRQQQQQEQLQPACQRGADLRTTLEANRQQLLQLQEQYKLRVGIQQRAETTSCERPQGGQQHGLATVRMQMPGHTAAAALTAAGRPSTVLSLLNRSDSYSGDHSHGSDSLRASMDSVLLGDSCITQEGPTDGDAAASSPCQAATAAPPPWGNPSATNNQGQHLEQQNILSDDSGVLMGSMALGVDFDCNSYRARIQATAAAGAPAAERCGSSCSVQGPASAHGRPGTADSASAPVDDASDSISSPRRESSGGGMCGAVQQPNLQAAGQSGPCSDSSLQGPALIDSQSCLPTGTGGKHHRDLEQADLVPPDRKVQSCPTINPLLSSSSGSHQPAVVWGLGTGHGLLAAASSDQQQHPRSSPHAQGTWLGTGTGVTLSPEVMRRGQLVKQSCPTLRFPRYGSHSPAKHSKEDLPAAAVDDSGDDDAADAAPRRSRLALASSSSSIKQWQQQQPPCELNIGVAGAPEQDFAQEEPDVTAAEQVVSLSPIFHQHPGAAAANDQQESHQSEVEFTAPEAAGTASATEVQQEPAQNSLLQALLFSSCDFGSSLDLCQQAAPQQVHHTTQLGMTPGGSPQKVQLQSFWQEQQQPDLEADGLARNQPISTDSADSSTVHAMGGVLLSPIAESPAVCGTSAGPTSGVAGPAVPTNSNQRGLQLASAGSQLEVVQHEAQLEQEMVGAPPSSPPDPCPTSIPDVEKVQQLQELVPAGLQQLLALTGSAATQQEQQARQQSTRQNGLGQQELLCTPQAQRSHQPEAVQQPSDASNLASSLLIHQASEQQRSMAAVIVGHFSRAAGKAGGPIGYHRVVNRKQPVSGSSSGGQSRRAAQGIATQVDAGTFASRSVDPLVRGPGQQRQQQQLAASLGSIKVSDSIAGASVRRPLGPSAAKVATASATTKGLGTTAAVARGRRGSTGSSLTSATQGLAVPVRTSHLKLDLSQLQVPDKHSSLASAASGSNNSPATASAGAATAAAPGGAVSGKGSGGSRYEQLLKSQYGKAPLLRNSQAGVGVGRQPQDPPSQLHDIGAGPIATSLCLSDLVASSGGSTGQTGPSVAGVARDSGAAEIRPAGMLQQKNPLPHCSAQQPEARQRQGEAAAVIGQATVLGQFQPDHGCSNMLQWHSSRSQSAHLPFAQPADELNPTRHSQPLYEGQQHQLPGGGVINQQMQQHRSVSKFPGQPADGAAGTAGSSPASPTKQLNIFLPRLVVQQLLTPQTAEQPARHIEFSRPVVASQNEGYVQRGPTPSTPPWLGMASPKSGTKQQHAHGSNVQYDQQQQQHHEQVQTACSQAGQQHQEQSQGCVRNAGQQGQQQLVTQQISHVQAVQSAQEELVRSIDAAIEAASASLGNPSRCSSTCSAGSTCRQPRSQLSVPAAAAACEDEACSTATVAQHAAAADATKAVVAVITQPTADRALAGGTIGPGAHSASMSPTNKQRHPAARSCPMIASPMRASQISARGPAMVASYRLQNVGQAHAGVAGSSFTQGQRQPTPVLEGSSTAAAAAAGWASTPGSSTVLVSIVKHGRGRQQEQVQLQQCYEFEAQPIQEVVQLDVPAGVDSCASFSSNMVAGDGESVEAMLYASQQEAPGGSPTGAEVSMSAANARKSAARQYLAAAAADEEEVASSDEPVMTSAPAEPSVASDAGSMPSSPGSCSSAVSSSVHKAQQRRGLPSHLFKQGLKSRLGLQQLAAANSAASSDAYEGFAAAAKSDNGLKPQEQHDPADFAAVHCSDGSSTQPFCTASSQMGTVWPHAVVHADNAADLSLSVSSTSSVSNTGLQQQPQGPAEAQDAQDEGQQQRVECQIEADQPATAGGRLARSYYRSSAVLQQAGHSSATVSSKHSSQCSVAASASSSGMHSLWDETDPVEDVSSSPGADTGIAAAMQIDSDMRASQQQHASHVRRGASASGRATGPRQGLAAARPGSIAVAAQEQSAKQARGSVCESLGGSSASGVSVVSEADSASSAAGPPQQHAVAGAGPEAGPAVAAEGLDSQEQQQQQHRAPGRGSRDNEAASTSLSFAAMHHAQSSYSSPGVSSAVAAASRANTLAAEEAIPAGPQPAQHASSDSSEDGSVVGSSGSAPVQAGLSQLSLDDLGVGDSQKPAGKRQSPSKPPARDQSPNKPPSVKHGTAVAVINATMGEVTTSQESCGAKAAATGAAASTPGADQDQAVADDAASTSGKGSRPAAAVVHRMQSSQAQQQQQQQHSASVHLDTRLRQQPQLQVVLPSSPKLCRTLGSAAVNFSPLHAGRSSKGSCCSAGQVTGTPGILPLGALAQGPAAPAAFALQPAFCADSLATAAGAPAAEGAATAGSAKQPSVAAHPSPCTGFSPLHSMMPGSGSCGKVSSKTHSRTKKGSASQDEEVSVVRKNLMDDMLKAAAVAGNAPATVAYAATAVDAEQHSDTHEVRDSKQGPAAAASCQFGFDQTGTLLHTPARLQKGSVLDKVTLQLPALSVSPAPQQQQNCSGDTDDDSSAVPILQSEHTVNDQVHSQSSYALRIEGELLRANPSGIASEASLGTVGFSGVSDSLQLMSQSSIAAAAALRAAAATPAPIPQHGPPTANAARLGHPAHMQQQPDRSWQQQMLHEQDAGTASQGRQSSEDVPCAVLSLDGVIPPVGAVSAAPHSIIVSGQNTAAGATPATSTSSCARPQSRPQQKLPAMLSGIPQPAAVPTAPSSDSKLQHAGAGPLSSGLLRRGNSAGSLSKMLMMGLQLGGITAACNPADSKQAASASAGQAAAASGGDSACAAGSHGDACEQSPCRPKQLPAPAARAAGSPYLQQLEENCAQQQQQQHRMATASPLSLHRHNLQLWSTPQQQQAASPAAHATAGPGVDVAAAEASSPMVRPASSSGRLAVPTPVGPCFKDQQVAGAAGAEAHAAGQDLAAVGRGASCSGHISPTPGGSSGGAARMGRLRHRRARSDMPEYYPLSPLESPLHAAMPEDHLNVCELTLTPQVSAAAVAALAAADAAGAAVSTPGAGAMSRLVVGQGAVEPPASPLGSPLRHGLTSPAAMYRIQQQQLKEQASQQHLAAEQSGVAVQVSAASPAVSREQSKLEVPQQKQVGVAQAVAEAVAAYEGSISPRRLAKIQEYVSGLVAADGGGSILAQRTPNTKGMWGCVPAATPVKESDAFDSFNLNNQQNLETELQQHGQQLEQQQQELAVVAQQTDQQQQAIDVLQQDPSQDSLSAVLQEKLSHYLPQHQDLHPREQLSGILSACLSQCSASTIRASVGQLATKVRASTSSTSTGSRPNTAAAAAAAGEGECATAVAQLLQVRPPSGDGQPNILQVQHERSGMFDSSMSQQSSFAASDHVMEQLGHQQPLLTSARLRQHSIGSSGSHHSSHQLYPLNVEPSYASSAAASQAEMPAAAAGDRTMLASVQELLAPSLFSASTESVDLPTCQQASIALQAQPAAEEQSLVFRQSQDSQQEAVMQSHGALLGPGLPELSTAAGGAVFGSDRPVSRHAAAPAGHALAGGMFRRSAQVLAGLAQGLWQPVDVGSVDSTAGSMAVVSGAVGSRATCGMPDDDDFGSQLRASVNLVAGSLDISGPQVRAYAGPLAACDHAVGATNTCCAKCPGRVGCCALGGTLQSAHQSKPVMHDASHAAVADLPAILVL